MKRRSQRSLDSESAFFVRMSELGMVVTGEYVNNKTPVDAVCASGHACKPRPNDVQQGHGACLICAGKDPVVAEEAFRDQMTRIGATVVGEYVNNRTPVDVQCANGHACKPRPSDVTRGQGLCKVCVGTDPVTAEAKFRARLAELGATMVGVYAGNRTPVRVTCAAGHDCNPRPSGVVQGQGVCLVCARRSPDAGKSRLESRLAELGAQLVGAYINQHTPVHVVCAAGHDCFPRPSGLLQGQGACGTCAGNSNKAAEAAFVSYVTSVDASITGAYVDSKTPVYVVCAEGHDCYPRPNNVQQGDGICSTCAGNAWDAVYVVRNADVVKFGITTGDTRRRLVAHKRDGLTDVVRLFKGIPDGFAQQIERQVLAALKDAGEKPVRGREYFDIGCLGLILDVVDNHPAVHPS